MLTVIGTGARAEEREAAPNDLAAATEGRAAFVLGTELARRGQWVDALAAFERSRRLRAHPITTYNVAFSERAIGHFSRARILFRRALDEHERGGDGRLTEDLERSAISYSAELELKVASVHVTVPARVAVSVDGRPLEAESTEGDAVALVAGVAALGPPTVPPSGAFVLRIDPGPHTVELVSEGGATAIERRDVAEDAPTKWNLGAPVALGAVSLERPVDPPPPGVRAAGFVSIGVGAALVGASVVTGALHFVQKAELEEICIRGECPTDHESRIAQTNALGTLTWVGVASGLVSVAIGTGLLVGYPAAPPQKVGIWPALGPTRLGVAGRF